MTLLSNDHLLFQAPLEWIVLLIGTPEWRLHLMLPEDLHTCMKTHNPVLYTETLKHPIFYSRTTFMLKLLILALRNRHLKAEQITCRLVLWAHSGWPHTPYNLLFSNFNCFLTWNLINVQVCSSWICHDRSSTSQKWCLQLWGRPSWITHWKEACGYVSTSWTGKPCQLG